MGLSIVIDKSTFQSLSSPEIISLHNYYRPTITPILVMEIMADLKKEFDKTEDSNKRVQDFAKKLMPYNSAINIHYLEILTGELLYGNSDFNFRPVLGNSEVVKSSSGKIGFQFKETAQEKALSRWRDGDFLKSEEELAKIWRDYTKKEDLLENLKKELKKKYSVKEKFKDLKSLIEHIEELLNKDAVQQELLIWILSEFGISLEYCGHIFARWEQCELKRIREFSEFAFHCCKVKLLFDFALRFGLVGTRSTNILDLQYLYYLPFCLLFSTNDKFQLELAPFLITENQKVIKGSDLKNDLKLLVDYCETLDDPKDKKRVLKEPPQLPQSLTYQLWSEYFDWPPRFKIADDKPPKYYKEKMDEFINASKTERKAMQNNDPDFIVREHLMKGTDFCVCGSGKQLKDCCGKSLFDKDGQPIKSKM
jgi:hypothetical protein